MGEQAKEAWEQFKRHPLPILIPLAAIAVLILFSSSYTSCAEEYYQRQNTQQPEEGAAIVIRAILSVFPVMQRCTGKFVESNADAIIALFTIVLAVSTILLWLATDRLWKAGELGRQETERAFVAVETIVPEITTQADSIGMDYINPGGGDPGLNVTRFAVQPLWSNSGNTPTKGMTIRIDWCGIGDAREVGSYRNDAVGFFVGPKATMGSEFFEMPGLNGLINNGSGVLGVPVALMLVWGRADYSDLFGRPHFVEWCYRVRPERHAGEKLRVYFIQWGDYNRTD